MKNISQIKKFPQVRVNGMYLNMIIKPSWAQIMMKYISIFVVVVAQNIDIDF